MISKHFKYCVQCKSKLLSDVSFGYGKCYYCRNYTKIELQRLVKWNSFWNEMLKMPETNRFEIFSRKTVALDLIGCKKIFVKNGTMTPQNKKVVENRSDKIALMIGMRDPRIETKIQWVKYNSQGVTRKL